MATAPSTPQTRQNHSLPPRRGQIKAQIFENLIGSFSFVASKAGEALGRIMGIGAGSGSGGGSASTTPPASAETSDGYSDHA